MRIIIDTDPAMGSKGGDPEDSFAIMLALNSPEVTVEGVTVVQGNVPVSHGYPNARYLMELMGRTDVPVLSGVELPLNLDRKTQVDWLGRRGQLPSIVPARAPEPGEPSAVDFIIETVRENPGEITLVTIGPLTNIAAALQREPALASDAARIVSMAGAAVVPGNITPAAEFNVWADPEAAAIVFESGIPITMVGLDVCHETHLRLETMERVGQGGSDLARFAAEAVTPWMEFRAKTGGEADLHLYDSLAVAAAFRPDFLTCEESYVAIETEGRLTQGETVAHLGLLLKLAQARGREPNAQVALAVDAAGFEAFFEERVIEPMLGS
jgi:inosine-uridine nucleoside N-ribohydrolase